jgi:hypothetical protein
MKFTSHHRESVYLRPAPSLTGTVVASGSDFLATFGKAGERYVYARYFTQRPVFGFLHDLKEDPQELKNLARADGQAAC